MLHCDVISFEFPMALVGQVMCINCLIYPEIINRKYKHTWHWSITFNLDGGKSVGKMTLVSHCLIIFPFLALRWLKCSYVQIPKTLQCTRIFWRVFWTHLKWSCPHLGDSVSIRMISIFKITYFQPCSQKMHNLILTFFWYLLLTLGAPHCVQMLSSRHD